MDVSLQCTSAFNYISFCLSFHPFWYRLCILIPIIQNTILSCSHTSHIILDHFWNSLGLSNDRKIISKVKIFERTRWSDESKLGIEFRVFLSTLKFFIFDTPPNPGKRNGSPQLPALNRRRSRRPRKNETAHDDDDAGGGGNDVRMNGKWFDAKRLKNVSIFAARKSPSFAVENFFRFLFFNQLLFFSFSDWHAGAFEPSGKYFNW